MITPESTIAQYRVGTLIGAGGMGEVYRATDSRLGRAVALKILPSELSESRERIRRFLQEAKAASSLNHPNIITVYDAGDAQLSVSGALERVYFIATELVEGKTLRDLIHLEKVPLKRLVGYLGQAADGIAKAHAAGIVHRDLKPDNIMVTTDGFAKVLDFGLAKLTEARSDQSTLIGATRDGVILGTVAYMSPEQAQGKPVDHRSDVFAFGAILYEAAAGQPPFSGPSDPDILHRIIHEDPPPLANVPAELERLITRAMAKDPEERIQSMKDLALELRDISRTFDSLRLTTPRRMKRKLRTRWPWVALAAAGLVGGLFGGYALRQRRAPEQPIRFAVAAPEGSQFAGFPNAASALQFALSPDGTKLVFVATPRGGRAQLWLRELQSVEARALAGTEGAWFPFWSPRGDAIAFFAGGKLKRISIHGGAAIVLADVGDPRGGSWSSDDLILFARAGAAPIYRVPATGGEATPTTTSSRGDYAHRWPHFLPDGKRFLYLVLGSDGGMHLHAGSLASRQTERLFAADSNAEYVPSGEIIFVRKGNLFAQRVRPDSLRPIGDAAIITRLIGYASAIDYGAFSTSRAGILSYAPWVNPNRRLTWLDRQGRIVKAASEPAEWAANSLSVRGEKAVVPRGDPSDGNLHLWSLDLTRGVATRLTAPGRTETHPVLSPDASSLVFTISRGGAVKLAVRNLQTSAERELSLPQNPWRASDWSGDGRLIVYDVRTPARGGDIWLYPIGSSGSPRPFLATPFSEWDGRVSPDGRWIAYVSDDAGREEVYVQPFPQGGERYRVSASGGMTPYWSPDGQELYFMTLDGEIASVRMTRSDTRFATSSPEVLFRIPGQLAPQPEFLTAYAATADGRFLVTITPEESSARAIHVTVNAR